MAVVLGNDIKRTDVKETSKEKTVKTNTEKTIVDSKGNVGIDSADIIEQVVAQEEGRLPNNTDELAGLTAEQIQQKIEEDKKLVKTLEIKNVMFEGGVVNSERFKDVALHNIVEFCGLLADHGGVTADSFNKTGTVCNVISEAFDPNMGASLRNELEKMYNNVPSKEVLTKYVKSICVDLPEYIKQMNAKAGTDLIKRYLDIEDENVATDIEKEIKELDKEIEEFTSSCFKDVMADIKKVEEKPDVSISTSSSSSSSSTSVLEWAGYLALAGVAAYGVYMAYDTFFGEGSGSDMGDVVILSESDAFSHMDF